MNVNYEHLVIDGIIKGLRPCLNTSTGQVWFQIGDDKIIGKTIFQNNAFKTSGENIYLRTTLNSEG